ncbi:MAG: Calx-beta domain-containing protein [Acidobacteriota bacterium]
MRYRPRISILRWYFTPNCLLAFAFFVILAGAVTLLFFMSGSLLRLESKATPETPTAIASAKKVNSKKAARKQHDEVRMKPDGIQVEKEEFPEGEADDPDARLNWFWFQRMYPFDEIPSSIRRRAWDTLSQREKYAALNQTDGEGLQAASTVWSPVGPAPTTSAFPNNGGATSGRINAIAVSPVNTQIVLIGTATGGIWRSTNGGTTFVPVTDTQVDLAVGTIAFAPSNPSIVYAGMGDNDNGYFGTGVLRSTDAGVTWTRVNNLTLPDKGQCMKILVDPANSDKVFLAQYSFVDANTNGNFISGIYVSNDGGVNWTKTLSCLVRDLAMHPTNSQILYAGVQFRTGDVPGLYKSTNGGQTWINVYASPYTSTQTATRDFRVAVTPASPNRVYIYFGTRTTTPFEVRLEVSDDSGTTFTNRGVISSSQIDVGQLGYNTYLAASPTNPDTVYVGTRDIFRSTDAGATFTDISNSFLGPWSPGTYRPDLQKFHSDQQSFTFQPGSTTVFYAGCDGGLWKTTDGGANFTSLNSSLSLTQFVSIGVHPTDVTRSYGGTQDNGTQRRLIGTNGWKEFSSGDGGKLVINPLSPSMVFTSYVSGRVSRFLSDGFSFSGVIADADTFGESLSSPRISFYPPIAGNGVNAKLYIGTWRLFICTDCDNSSKVYGGGNPPTWTAPGGTTDLTNGGTDVLTSIAVAKSNNNVIYTGSRSGRAMVSVNAGVNWTDLTAGLPNRSITSITVSPTDPNLVYLTVSGYGSGHVFRSTNAGTTWTNINNNLPNIPTSAFLIDPVNSTTLYAGTDIGVFRSTDNGATWAAFNNGLPPVPVLAFSAQASGLIQIGTYGRGAYELPAGSSTPPPTVRLTATDYPIAENSGPGFVTVSVIREGDASSAASVNFATSDTSSLNAACSQVSGKASDRCDYATSLGTLSWAAGESGTKSFNIPIINDALVEGNETFNVTLSSPTGVSLGATTTATVTIQDNDSSPSSSNPIDGVDFFITQQYIDILGRMPDAGGFQNWHDTLAPCPNGGFGEPPTSNCDRLHVAAGFFQSAEFLNRGYFAFRFYMVAFNQRPTYAQFMPDMAQVGGPKSPAEEEAAKVAYANAFVVRPAFTSQYPGLSGQALANALLQKAGLPAGSYNAGGQSNGQILRGIAESQGALDKFLTEGTVSIQYFAFLRRDPDTTGYNNNVATLNANPSNLRHMIFIFIYSTEYRGRFGTP